MARGRSSGFQMGAEHRSKIGNSKVLGELLRFAEGQISPEEYPPHRVTAALGLLKKVMPDLAQTDLTSGGEKIEMPTKIILQAAHDNNDD